MQLGHASPSEISYPSCIHDQTHASLQTCATAGSALDKNLCKEIFVNGLVAEVEVPGVAIIGNAVALNPITQLLKLSTTSLIITLTLHLCGPLILQEVLSQTPCLLPDVLQPLEELIDLEVWASIFRRRSHQKILACKEMPDGTMLLLVSCPDAQCNLVIAMCWLLRMRLHLLHELWTWGQPIDDVHSKHCNNVFVGEWHVLSGKDVTLFPGIVHHGLRVRVRRPIQHGKLGRLVKSCPPSHW
jgi:hypothetical protein